MNKFTLVIIVLFISFKMVYSQEMNCNDFRFADAYSLAINTVKINIRRGILAAGGDYGGEWTRDIAINSWNCVSLLFPEVAEKSLWSVTLNKDTIGHQYWDRIIWVLAALNHYRVTDDYEFLQQSYKCSVNSIKQLEALAFDISSGLFYGPSVFNDGIAGYPEPVFDSTNSSSFVLDHKNAAHIKCLSTNCIYYGAYKSLIEMAKLLNENESVIFAYSRKADNLKEKILKHFYLERENKLIYLIDHTGNTHNYQEALGISFAVIFGILDKEKAAKLIQSAVVSKYGITSIYPDFPRYSPEKPGRHNNIIWPMVNGFFAMAAIAADCKTSFEKELYGLTQLALNEDKGNYQFWEIYNPYTGVPDGGCQSGSHWQSCRLQTWSATAYINMIHYGLAGIRIENDEITFSPYLPKSINHLELTNLKYRQAALSITVKGSGSRIKTFLLNGTPQTNYKLDSSMKGLNEIVIEVEE